MVWLENTKFYQGVEAIMTKKLEVHHLAVSFVTEAGKLQAVRDISFSLEQGSTLAIVGESGSGKSVTGRAIMGLLAANATVESGQILLDGQNLLELTPAQWCRIRGKRIAMVFQDPLSCLNPVMRVGRQIAEAMRKTGLSRRQARQRAIELMGEVGIDQPEQRYDAYPFEFSGGMRQRIVIAIALASDPEVLICDEPTTALDVTIQAQILELINKLKREHNLSIIFITHDLGVVAEMADDIAVMYAGRIVEYGRAEEVFYDPRHPYTWALLASMPDLNTEEKLISIPGTPPDMTAPPLGDAFAPRNAYALDIDFLQEPPAFPVSATHWAATWLLHPYAPRMEPPAAVRRRIARAGEEGM